MAFCCTGYVPEELDCCMVAAWGRGGGKNAGRHVKGSFSFVFAESATGARP